MTDEITTLDDFIPEQQHEPLSKEYIAGLIDGEGCFGLGIWKGHIRMDFHIGMRADSLPLLKQVRHTIGVGTFHHVDNTGYDYRKQGSSAPSKMNPAVQYCIGRQEDMLAFAEWCDDIPLREKQQQFKIWRDALHFYVKHNNGKRGRGRQTREWVKNKMKEYVYKIKKARSYDGDVEIDFDAGVDINHRLTEWDGERDT